MVNKKGFTLIELMISLSIVGMLFVSAMPLYSTYQQRARGSEASIMLKQIINAEIAHFLENNEFYPSDDIYFVPHSGDTDPPAAVEDIANNLHIDILQGHLIDYTISGRKDAEGNEEVYININSSGNFNLFKNTPSVIAILDKDGQVQYFY